MVNVNGAGKLATQSRFYRGVFSVRAATFAFDGLDDPLRGNAEIAVCNKIDGLHGDKERAVNAE